MVLMGALYGCLAVWIGQIFGSVPNRRTALKSDIGQTKAGAGNKVSVSLPVGVCRDVSVVARPVSISEIF